MSHSERTSVPEAAVSRPRVLVVDDSAFMRRLISDVIGELGEFDVVGTARDGHHAIAQVRALNPDIVTLDVDMPGQDGLDTLRQIMHELPRPVVMLSAGGSDGGVEATLRALEFGAVDFVRKPSGAISLDLELVRGQLLDALRAATSTNRALIGRQALPEDITGSDDNARASALAHARAPRISRVPSRRSATGLVCLAASTGGPAALTHVVPNLPCFDEVAVAIVQHMPAGFTRSLAQRLDQMSSLTVLEAEHGQPVLAGHAYIAPGGFHLRIALVNEAPTCVLDTGPTRWGVRPAADYLFHSAAQVYGLDCIGVVMTGMGSDGAEGLFEIRRAGGVGVVQDAESSVIAGMPNAALRHAGADHIASLGAMAELLAALATSPVRTRSTRTL